MQKLLLTVIGSVTALKSQTPFQLADTQSWITKISSKYAAQKIEHNPDDVYIEIYGNEDDSYADKYRDFLLGPDDPYTFQTKVVLTPEEKAKQVIDRHLGDVPGMIEDLMAQLDQRIGSQIDKFTDLVHDLEKTLDQQIQSKAEVDRRDSESLNEDLEFAFETAFESIRKFQSVRVLQ